MVARVPRPCALLRTVLLTSAVVALAPVSAASAATVFVSSSGGVFVGGDDSVNQLFITTPSPMTISVRADVGTVEPGGPGCTQLGGAVECSVTQLDVEVNALDGNDVIDVAGPITARLYGGQGGDVLRGGDLADLLVGEDADIDYQPVAADGGDELFGRGGNDDLRGDEGPDRLDGGEGSDLHVGGPGGDTFQDTGTAGTDSVTYKVDAVQTGVRVSVGDGPNDGQDAGLEGDDVGTGFERIQGSSFDDVLRGGATAETINGASGADDIDGGGGADTIEGNGGNDILRAQDGIADTRLDCDAASDPAATNGTDDVAFLDAIGVDPDPERCETVTRSGGGSGATPPANSVAPAAAGLTEVDQRLTCQRGTWSGEPAFAYAWFGFTADGQRVLIGNEQVLTVPPGAAGLEVECEVSATNPGGTTRSRSPRRRIAARTGINGGLRTVDLAFPDYTVGTKACGGKRFCEAAEVQRDVDKLGAPVRFMSIPVAGLRTIPRELRETIRPGAVFATSPKPGKRFTAGPDAVGSVKVRYYVPDAARDCPIGQSIGVRGGRDYTFEELLVGFSLRDALSQLKRERCRSADYDIQYRYKAHAPATPTVAAARVFDERGNDRIRLTVDHSAPGLALSMQPLEPKGRMLPLLLADDGNASVRLVANKKQRSRFAIAVATRAGVGLADVRVELRDQKGDLAGLARTGADGVANLTASVDDDGAYELWASATDVEGDSLVGWKPLKAVTQRQDFTGFDGLRYRFEGKTFAPGRTPTRAAISQAAEDRTVTEMRDQAALTCDRSRNTRFSSFISSNAVGLSEDEAAAVTSASQTVCLFSTGQIDLARMRGAGVTPALATLGGTQTLAVGTPAYGRAGAVGFVDNRLYGQTVNIVKVGAGALSFVADEGVVLYTNGLYAIQSGGGAEIGASGPRSRTTVDTGAANFAIDLVGPYAIVGFDPSRGGSIISGGAGNIISNDGASIISGGAGNIISNDGASLLGQDGAGIISGGAGN